MAHGTRTALAERLAEPGLGRRDMHERGRLRPTGIVRGQRVEDVLVLGHRARAGTLLGDAPPRSGPDGAAGDGVEHGGQRLVPGCGGHEPVEVRVVLDAVGLGACVAHALQAALQRLEGLRVDPLGGQGRGGRLQDAPDADELEGEARLHQLDGCPDALQQELRPEARDIRPVAPTHVEDARRDERADGLPDRVARGPELGRELRLRGQAHARHQVPGRDHLAHPGDRGFGERGTHVVSS